MIIANDYTAHRYRKNPSLAPGECFNYGYQADGTGRFALVLVRGMEFCGICGRTTVGAITLAGQGAPSPALPPAPKPAPKRPGLRPV